MPFHIVGTLLLSAVFLQSGSKTSPPPKLVSPANGAVMDNGCHPKRDAISWDFDWTDVPGAVTYRLIVWRGDPDKPYLNVEVKSIFANTPASRYHWAGPSEVALFPNSRRTPEGFYFTNTALRTPGTFYFPNTDLKGWRWKVQAVFNELYGYNGGKWSAVHRFRVEKLNTDCP